MTITYQYNVANTSFLGFGKLLLQWRGSVYKLVYKELLVYAFGYAVISIIYRFYLSEKQKRTFEKVVLYCDQTSDLIPLSFVLGFYVTCVVTRWMNLFVAIPWPDRIMHAVALYIHGTDTRGRLIRRSLMRYINLCIILLYQSISGAVKKRFPNSKQLVDAGFMTAEERHIYDTIPTKVNKHWVPLIWFVNLLNTALKEDRIDSGAPMKHILEEVNGLRSKTSLMWGYDWVTIPLVYTQVVTMTTHLFFVTCLFSRQFLDPEQNYPKHEVDLYFPLFTFLQFFFFMGWLKVAEQLINPLGEDDDDFETNWMIDRNIQVSYLAVDSLCRKLPKIERDIHWNKNEELDIPYTEASIVHKIPTYRGSTMHMIIPNEEQTLVFGQYLQQPSLCNSFLTCITEWFCCRAVCHKICNSRFLYREKAWPQIETAGSNYQDSMLGKSTLTTLGSKMPLLENKYLGILNRGERSNSFLKRMSFDNISECSSISINPSFKGERNDSYVKRMSLPIINRSNSLPCNLPYKNQKPSFDRAVLSRVSESEDDYIIEDSEDVSENSDDKVEYIDCGRNE